MKFHVVTTMNAAVWEETGRRMVASFLERWPTSARLTVYAEDFEPGVPEIEVRQLPAWVFAFNKRYRATPAFIGRTQRGYDYRFDAVKFAWKSAALSEFGIGLDDGVMIWLDADTFTHATVTDEWLAGLFPEQAYIAWLERRGSHPETGFIMFRCGHPYHRTLMENFRAAYTSGAVLRMRETHDAAVLFDLVTTKVAVGKIPAPHSLSGDKNWHHPFISGPIGSCLDHMKGERKRVGSSSKRDLKQPRPEPYWQSLPR